MSRTKQGTCWEGYIQKGMKKKGNKMVPNCVPARKILKASMGRAAFSEITSKAPKTKHETYNGSHIKSDIGGKVVSNTSYEKYYKGMI